MPGARALKQWISQRGSALWNTPGPGLLLPFIRKQNLRFAALVAGVLFVFGLAQPGEALAQKDLGARSERLPYFHAHYTYNLPQADLGDRFGGFSNVGGGFHFKTISNWTIGLSGSFLFGGTVNEGDILNELRTRNGPLINQGGRLEEVFPRMRGFRAALHVGRIFELLAANPNSGILVQLGGGLLQHHIDFEFTDNALPQLTEERQKGYDRLTNGFALVPQLSYFFLDPDNFWNFTVGIEGTLAFTQNRRSWDFYTNRKIDERRLDAMVALKAAFLFPVFDKQTRMQR
jgi:hypothetical protein